MKEKALKEEQAQQEKQKSQNLQQNSNANGASISSNEPVTINSLQKSEMPVAQMQPQAQVQNAPNFDKVLEQKIANSTFAPNELKDERFVEFFNSKNHETKLQHLVIAAFYLLQFEILKFTLNFLCKLTALFK